jgi:hypothetical protein
MHFWRNSAHAHGPRGEASNNRRYRLNLFEGNGRAALGPQSEKASQRHQFFGLIVHAVGVGAKDIKALAPSGVLESEHRWWYR